MLKENNSKFLKMKSRRGASDKVGTMIGVVILLILIGVLAPIALVGLFNSSAFVGVPAWVSSILGILGAIAFVYIIWRAAKS